MGTARGQAVSPSTSDSDFALQEVKVTGSRITRTTDFTAPTPTTVIDAAALENMGIVNAGEALKLTPANISTFTPASTGNSNFFGGSYIPNLRGLNPFFGSRTLTLINSRRVVQSNQGDSFDLNFIPQILIDHIDTVTGGASAAYGSGAIAGVMNVLLDTKLEGGKVNADFAQTSRADARNRHFGAAYGHRFSDNRVYFVLGGEYEKQDALGCQHVRDWCSADADLYPIAISRTSVPTYAYGSHLRLNQVTMTGVFSQVVANADIPIGLQTTPDGTNVMPYDPGQIPFVGDPPRNAVPGGDGEPINEFTNLMAPVNREVITGMLRVSLTDSINFTADANWGQVVTADGTQSVVDGHDSLSFDNAYLTPALTAALFPGGSATPVIGFNKDFTSQVNSLTRYTTRVKRFSVGFDGGFGDSSWSWDSYYDYGVTHREQLVQDTPHLLSYYMALDSVIGPDGQPECRVSRDGSAAAAIRDALFSTGFQYFPLYGLGLAGPAVELLAPLCQPINPFGTQPLSRSAHDYAFGNLDERLRYEQKVAAVGAQGPFFRGVGAGSFALAAGFEWRREIGRNDENPCATGVSPALCQAQNDDFVLQYGEPFGGGVTVQEAYLEANLPLVRKAALAHSLEIDLAARLSRYDNKALYGINVTPGEARPQFRHDLTTWKATLSWEPISGVRLRGTRSRDARAANFRELYFGLIQTPGGLFGYCNNDFRDPCFLNLEGNIALRPETSDTTTLGIVLRPDDRVAGLEVSADWFHIRISNAIGQPNPESVWTGCRGGVGSQCALMEFNDLQYDANPANPNYNLPCGGAVDCGTDPTYSGAAAWRGGVDNGTATTATSYNGTFYEVGGVDFSLNYTRDLGKAGSVNARLLTTFMNEQRFQGIATGPVYNILGQTGAANSFVADYQPTAKWRGSFLVTWSRAPLSITPSMLFVGHGIQDFRGVTPQQSTLYDQVVNGSDPAGFAFGYHPLPSNSVPSYFLFNLNAAYTLQGPSSVHGLQLFVQVNNIFDRTPPIAFFGIGGTNPTFFDTLGLSYRVGVRMSL